jgi:lipid-binding SYLF domain-containing protein
MKTKGILKVFTVMLALVFLMVPVVSAASLVEKRQHIRDISETTLLKLYSLQPNARRYVENAAGYGVFGNWGVKLLFIGGGTGKGMVVKNSNNFETYMDMIAGTVGFGLGAKTYNIVFIFETEKALNDFTENGWQFGGQVTAAATDSVSGDSYQGAFSVAPGVWMYEMTDKGIALEVTLKGAKFSKNDLN